MMRSMVRMPLGISGFLLALVVTGWLACDGNNPAGSVPGCRFMVIAGAGGEIIAPAKSVTEVTKGATASLSARANPGYAFARWTVFSDSAVVTYQNVARAMATVNGTDTVRAEFVAVPALSGHVDLSGFPTENGLNFLRFKRPWSTLPDFSSLTPDSAGPVDTFGISSFLHGNGNFGAILSGYLSIPLDGSYIFYLSSSDSGSGGSSLFLNDSLVLSNDGIRSAPREDSVTLPLTTGFYYIEARCFGEGAAPFLNVSYACPDVGIDKIPIPRDALYRADTRPVSRIFVTRPAGGETFRLGDTIHVQWTYKNPRGQTVAQISADNGKSYLNITNNAFPGTVSSYDWVIPIGADSLITRTAVIRLKEYPPFDANGVSRVFSIVAR